MELQKMQKEALLSQLAVLHKRKVLSETVSADYFEPGMMENLDQSEGLYDEVTGNILLRFESRGVRYEGRTERIEKVSVGDALCLQRDMGNAYNTNNFLILTEKGHDVGNMPAELCNVIAPLYDTGQMEFLCASVSYVEPISKRSRHAKQAVLFVELHARLLT